MTQTFHVYPHPPDMVLRIGDRVHTGPDGNVYGRIVDIAEDRSLVKVRIGRRHEEWIEAYVWRAD